MDGTHTTAAEVVSRLDDIAVQIRTLEAEADILLREHNDPAGAEANFRRKAELLSEMPDSVEDHLEGLAPALREKVEEGVDGFAQRAMMALNQGSVFWMRNLLYPEDYKEGQPNDLERFIESIAKG